MPYLTFHDGAGEHTLQMREWGTFEYLRKHEFKGEGLDKALHLRTPGEQWLPWWGTWRIGATSGW